VFSIKRRHYFSTMNIMLIYLIVHVKLFKPSLWLSKKKKVQRALLKIQTSISMWPSHRNAGARSQHDHSIWADISESCWFSHNQFWDLSFSLSMHINRQNYKLSFIEWQCWLHHICEGSFTFPIAPEHCQWLDHIWINVSIWFFSKFFNYFCAEQKVKLGSCSRHD
jgi:hypothetical protein